jgi:hypothetical protein
VVEPPVQYSAASHSPPRERQTVLLDAYVSAGHAVLVPLHTSETGSHGPTDGRHEVPDVA